MTHFEDIGEGCERFEYKGWEVRIWPGIDNRIDVEAPGQRGPFFTGPYHRVEVSADGIWVSGMYPGGFSYSGDAPSAFTVPWAVIQAIIDARARIGV